METINISTLKAHLSEIISKVRNGAVFTVLDRKTAVAMISSTKINELVITRAKSPGFSVPKSSGLNVKIDPLETLLQDRRKR